MFHGLQRHFVGFNSVRRMSPYITPLSRCSIPMHSALLCMQLKLETYASKGNSIDAFWSVEVHVVELCN